VIEGSALAMNETEVQALERFVAENDDLLALEEQIGKFNIFDALGIARVEIRHSNYLAWLLTPGESHGQGDQYLRAVLIDVLRKARQQGIPPPISPVELDGADLQGVEVRREWRYIDLLISCKKPSIVFAVENKVDSGEREGQLKGYKETVAKDFPGVIPLFLFLTPEGEEASYPGWVSYSYADLYQALTRTRKSNAGSLGGDVSVFLDHYLSLIGNRFMENPDLDKLCLQIYANHRQALDLIWERVTPSSELVGRIRDWIEQRPTQWYHIKTKQKEVRFIPASWDKMLPPIYNLPKSKPEHWMTLRLYAGNTSLRLFVDVCPTTNSTRCREMLERILKSENEFGFSYKKKLTEDWTRVLSEKVCELPEDEEPDIEAVMARVEKQLGQFLEKTAGLPAALAFLKASQSP